MKEEKTMNEKGPNFCSICEKSFQSQDELKEHNRNFHPEKGMGMPSGTERQAPERFGSEHGTQGTQSQREQQKQQGQKKAS
jgi:hypothetical protein